MRECRRPLPSPQEDFAIHRFRKDDSDGGRLLWVSAVPSEEHGTVFAAPEVTFQGKPARPLYILYYVYYKERLCAPAHENLCLKMISLASVSKIGISRTLF